MQCCILYHHFWTLHVLSELPRVLNLPLERGVTNFVILLKTHLWSQKHTEWCFWEYLKGEKKRKKMRLMSAFIRLYILNWFMLCNICTNVITRHVMAKLEINILPMFVNYTLSAFWPQNYIVSIVWKIK